jgi:hypothetical protein
MCGVMMLALIERGLKMDLASKLRIIQARMNVSRDTLAALLDTAPTTLDGWFSGKFCPPGLVVRFIDAILAKPVDLDVWLAEQYERDHGREVPRKSRRAITVSEGFSIPADSLMRTAAEDKIECRCSRDTSRCEDRAA